MPPTAVAGPAVAKPGMVLRGRWKIGKHIAEGACGQVFEVSDVTGTQRQHEWVIKVTPLPPATAPGAPKRKNKVNDALKKNADTLYMEQLTYKNYLMGVPRIPVLPDTLAYGEDQGLRFLVMQKLGRTLMQDFEAQGSHYSPAQLADYGKQMLASLQALHERRLLFVDVKPENFMFGPKGEATLYMMDFGLVEAYQGTNGSHRVDTGGGGGGTPLFMSLTCHQGASPGRRDDVEALGLMLIMLLRGGHLPWADASSDADCLSKKKATTLAELVKGHAGGEHLKAFIELARSTPFEAVPDYPKFVAILEKLGQVSGGGTAAKAAAGKKKRAALGTGGGAKAKARAESAKEVVEMEEEEVEEKEVTSAKGRGRRAAKAPVAEPAPLVEEPRGRKSAGGFLALAAAAGRSLLQTVGIVGEGGEEGDKAMEVDDDVIDMTDGRRRRGSRKREEVVVIDDDDESTGSGGGKQPARKARARRAKAADKEEETMSVSDAEEGEGGKENVPKEGERKEVTLEVREGPHRGECFVLAADSKAVYAGKSTDCGKAGGVSLPKEGGLRAKHCKIEHAGSARAQALRVAPVGTGGPSVLVNGVAVAKSGRLVFPGDLIGLGQTTLMVKLCGR